MTKEELRKEAEEYANNLLFVYETDIVQRIVRERVKLALIDVLEPREKHIAELEESNKEWQRTCEAKSDTNSQLTEQLADRVKKIATLGRNVTYYAERAKHAELQNRDIVLGNKSLGERCLQLQKDKGNLTDRVRELEQQIEQAKKDKVVEHFEAYGQCRDSRRIAELEAQIEEIKCDVLSLIKDRMNDDIDQNIIERLADKWEIKEK